MATPPPNEAVKLAILRQQLMDKIKQDALYKQQTDRQYTGAIQPNPNWMPTKAKGGSMSTDAMRLELASKGKTPSVTAVKKRKDDKIPELEQAAKDLLAGNITRTEYDATLKKVKPVTKYKSVPQPASDEEALGALHEAKKSKWRGADKWEAGRNVGLRLDIPAYSDHGVWVNSIHDEDNGGVAYGPVSSVKDATFDGGASKAQRVATGEANKSPFAKIKGKWHPMEDHEAVEHMQKYMNHPDYAQIGYDPRRRDYFYERGNTRKPVTHSEHVVQIGPLVLAKNPKFGKRKDFGLAKGGSVPHLAIGGQGPRNFLKGSVENILQPMMQKVTTDRAHEMYTPDQIERLKSSGRLSQNDAMNQWIQSNLANYIRKQMGHTNDPVRKLAEQGILHVDEQTLDTSEEMANERRKMLSGERLAKSPLAQAWEDAVDTRFEPNTVGDVINIPDIYKGKHEPWMDKVDPKTNLYELYDTDRLGFDHMVDVLKEDLAEGRIRPEQLNKISIEHAVRRVHEYDQDKKKKMAEAQLKATESMPVHKEYDTGHKWIELAMPKELPEGWSEMEGHKGIYIDPEGKNTIHNPNKERLRDALKYEGDTMGHCVGGYTDKVARGDSRIFSLRDAKNEPHVTIEVKPYQSTSKDIPKEISDKWQNKINHPELAKYKFLSDYLAAEHPELHAKMNEPRPPVISQIFGKSNKKPKQDYIPFAQDFVKSGNWSEVRMPRQVDLHEWNGKYLSKEDIDALSPEEENAFASRNLGKAHGGRVTHAHHLEIEERPL